MIKLRHLLRIIKRHAKYPLTSISHEWCEGGEPHYHICYAARLLGSDLPKVCPYCTRVGFEPEHENECDLCKYFGIMDITESGFSLNIDSRIADLQKPAAWVNITSDKAAPYRGWAFYDVPVHKIVEQYAEGNKLDSWASCLINLDGDLIHRGNCHAVLGEFAKGKQEVNIHVSFVMW